jgi:hypothetical protein
MITPFARPAAMITAAARPVAMITAFTHPVAMIAGVMSRYMAPPGCWWVIRRQTVR